MFESIAALVTRRAWIVILGWIVASAVFFAIAPDWEAVSRDDDVRFFPAGFPSVIGQELLERGFPDDTTGSDAVVIFERPDSPLSDADYAYIRETSKLLRTLVDKPKQKAVSGIKKVVDYREPVIGARLVGTRPDGRGQTALTYVSISSTYISKQTRLAVDRIQEELKKLPPAPSGLTTDRRDGVPSLPMTGSAVVGHDTNQSTNASVAVTTYTTIILVVVILLVVYRSPLLALIPLVTIALSVKVSLWGIAALTRIPGLHFQVISLTRVFVTVVLFGAGTDYCLFLIARYREELARGNLGDGALSEAIRKVGGALLASAGTVILGLGMLWFSSFAKIQYTGPAIALSLAIALAASLTLSPVLLHWLRGAVFWPFRPPHHVIGADPEVEGQAETPMHGFWSKVADLIVRRPGTILVLSLLALVPFAIVGARTKPNYGQLTDLGRDQPSIIGTQIIRKYFPVGELSRTIVLIENPKINFRSPAGRKAIEDLTRRLSSLQDVAEVRSVSQPLGPPPADFLKRQSQALALFAFPQRIDDRYISTKAERADRDHITRVEVVFKTDPFSEESLATLDSVRRTVSDVLKQGDPWSGTSFGIGGNTVVIQDLKTVTVQDERRMYVLVTVGVYLILVILLRRPWICLYLIATVVLGYLAALGLTELVFRSLHDGIEPWVGLDWKVGFFLFVILVAVGEDYNIFLMARILEEERKHGPIEGTRHAVANTGGIISSCGLIMACTLGSMMTGSLTSLREMGFALGIGVLLDTFIVRPVLVPAFVVLMHRIKGDVKRQATLDIGRVDQTQPSATSSPSGLGS